MRIGDGKTNNCSTSIDLKHIYENIFKFHDRNGRKNKNFTPCPDGLKIKQERYQLKSSPLFLT